MSMEVVGAARVPRAAPFVPMSVPAMASGRQRALSDTVGWASCTVFILETRGYPARCGGT